MVSILGFTSACTHSDVLGKQLLGESLCPHVSRECPEVTAKITAMLLEMDVPSLQRAFASRPAVFHP